MRPEYLLEAYATAVLHKDAAAYTSIFDENIRVFDMWQEWRYDGITAWREVAKDWFDALGADKDVVTFSDIEITEKGELALITAIAKFTATSEQGEALRYLENRLTWVAVKKGLTWKIIHQHTSSPIDFNTMQVVLKRDKKPC
ncbi:Ketosteroid isomerase homolog [Hydrobacter penzbergensis]|uniref:Ketosteroid isomerase homolog n=1 Tax=Hydrobacter penzbergensis TaxID=1235997 RepID=A0A8X8LDE6_9BACT|nr:nuclear transport factor 2 family protein [Hydrobacter penzbergensis]SDW80493.1 Ketosteroid isomerase homolog [Hydrobacter penzbergensis]